MIRTLLLLLAVVVCPATSGAQSFVSIFTRVPADFVQLAAPSSLAILGAAGGGSLALHPKDDEIARRANDPDRFFAAGDALGEGTAHAAAGLAIYFTGRLRHDTKWATLGHDLLRAQLVSGIVADGLKLATNRTRPNGGAYSFPSGHTSSAFATAAVFQNHFGWKAGVPAYLLATYVASSRMAHNRHYASDILFGMGIGVASGRATTFHLRHTTTVTVVPAVSPTSAAVNVSVTQ
jgi:membrane-associated phospholipid phosphatase